MIENASDEASVPQALTIMNGLLLSQITSGWPTFSLNLRKAATNEEKIDVLFLSLYSRPPTAKEKTHMLQTIESYASNNNLWEDITLAVLITQRFIFVESQRADTPPTRASRLPSQFVGIHVPAVPLADVEITLRVHAHVVAVVEDWLVLQEHLEAAVFILGCASAGIRDHLACRVEDGHKATALPHAVVVWFRAKADA